LFFRDFKKNEDYREYVKDPYEKGNIKKATLVCFHVAKDLAFFKAFGDIEYFRRYKAKRAITGLID